MTEPVDAGVRGPVLIRNFLGLAGTAIAIASLVIILFLFLIDITGSRSSPYVGILAYMVLPAVLIFGLILIAAGMILDWRRRAKSGTDESKGYLQINLKDARSRRRLLWFSGATLVFLFMTAFGSYRAYEYTDSVSFCGQLCHTVMKPEFTSYLASPHARVRCVDCHVGQGAGWYVRSKLSGAYQVYATIFNKYPRPIPTPVHNLRPAEDTCEQCHWPEKFFGAQLKVFNHYAPDEKNTPRQIRMLINTGGGSLSGGQVQGIHWHMNIANQIEYIATDEHRQVIPWVQVRDREGHVTLYKSSAGDLTPDQIEKLPRRRMDCVDCHNRPTHIYVPPDRVVDLALLSGRLDPGLPYLKQQSADALTKPYASTQEAIDGIASAIDGYYRENYPDVYSSKGDSIRASIAGLQQIYQTYFFPEMKVDWQTHPDNIGHFYSQGCFRCHDGRHTSDSGKVIRRDCNICHTTLDQTEEGVTASNREGIFQHPFDLDVSSSNCTECHTGKGLEQ